MWREYHEATKHSLESLRESRHFLDWANMPDPFRHYEGVPVLDLPADPPPPEAAALAVLHGKSGIPSAHDGAVFLSQLLYYSAAISAAKRVPSTGYKYALRVNPSSGNLHPTEFHFLTRGLNGWPDGLYHYRPSSHMAEQRAIGDLMESLTGISSPLCFILTSIAWREAWKYRARAYRYCLHDVGHAWEALTLAARAAGGETVAHGHFPDDELARACRFSPDEWPMLLIEFRGPCIPSAEPGRAGTTWFEGRANRLSAGEIRYPLIERMHAAAKLDGGGPARAALAPAPEGSGAIRLPPAASSPRPFGDTVRTRRSALDFTGAACMPLSALSAILDSAAMPLGADFASERLISLYLYVHRVDGLAPGVYRHWPRRRELEPLKYGDQRVMAAGLSLQQQLAGNACVAFSMIAGLARACEAYGDRGYRYAHFEAGAAGQRMYLAAEALGLQATGIGAFFDDQVHSYLELDPARCQVIYHFAIGHAVRDPRLEA
jgi:SagB-type dehydrogenase family enzyme